MRRIYYRAGVVKVRHFVMERPLEIKSRLYDFMINNYMIKGIWDTPISYVLPQSSVNPPIEHHYYTVQKLTI